MELARGTVEARIVTASLWPRAARARRVPANPDSPVTAGPAANGTAAARLAAVRTAAYRAPA